MSAGGTLTKMLFATADTGRYSQVFRSRKRRCIQLIN